ncbi:MAG: hypothetical protein K2H64_10400 [Desulfovibrio sp.]|nr:hypothetical protein [Desulfovibrio sp.]
MAIQKLENPIDDTRDIETIPREVIGKIYYPDGTREDMRGRPIDDAASKMENPDGANPAGKQERLKVGRMP